MIAHDEAHAWAASGAMELTGRADGPPLMAPGRPAGHVAAALHRFDSLLQDLPHGGVPLPDAGLLGERAAILGLRRQGPVSCGGSFRTMATVDGAWCLSMPRRDDLASVPALVSSATVEDTWAAVARWSARSTTADVVERGRLLGLACSALAPATESHRSSVQVSEEGRRSARRERPRVIDLTSLWAGPLCTHLLGLRGCHIIKVETVTRPDGARQTPTFFDLLHHGHDMVAVDFSSRHEVEALRTLMTSADLIIEASRPRAIGQLGINADDLVQAGVSWLSITGYGRDIDAIGFGDDVASGAGLTRLDGGTYLPVGDAIADPLTGVTAAVAAAEALTADRARLIDVSMHDVVRSTVDVLQDSTTTYERGSWWVETSHGRVPVSQPRGRQPLGSAGGLGRDTDRWIA